MLLKLRSFSTAAGSRMTVVGFSRKYVLNTDNRLKDEACQGKVLVG